jgi:hypothetical protein
MIDHREIVACSTAIGQAQGTLLGASWLDELPQRQKDILRSESERLNAAWDRLTKVLIESGDVQ